MARLGSVFRGRNVHCLSTTFIIVVFLTSIALLTLQPVQYPKQTSMLDLPIEEVVKVQSIPELETATKNSHRKSWRKKSEKNNKNKAIKDLWIKDELPKSASTHSPQPTNENEGDGTSGSAISSTKSVTKLTQTSVSHETPMSPSENPSTRAQTSSNPPKSHSLARLAKTPLKNIDSPFMDPSSVLKKQVEEKIITWYKPDSFRQTNQKKKVFQSCPESACKVVYPLPPNLQADAVVFNDVDPEDVPPERTHKDQVFVYHTMESPSFPEPGVWPKAWNSVFNWTWTYRRDSEIWQPFGLLTKAKKVPALDVFYKITATKDRPVAWLPQSCTPDSSSKRSEFVNDLNRYIPVTEYGGCNKKNKTCSKGSRTCSDHLSKNFFFLLALEEDICKDHVTGVFYRAWREDTHVVPVVRGGADYASYFPEGTFIDADWFDTPKELAGFLKKLMDKRKLYSQLLWRKAHWVKSKNSDGPTYCQFCYRLHHVESNRKEYPDMRRWFEDNVCKFPRPF